MIKYARQQWIYDKPPDHGTYLLLSVTREVTSGVWYGKVGDAYIAYAEMPLNDRKIEKALIAEGKIRKSP